MKPIFILAICSCTAIGGPSLARLPLDFEPGGRAFEFVAHTGGAVVTLRATEARIGRDWIRLVNANAAASGQAEELLPGYSNYLVGTDPKKWRTHVPTYARVRFRNVYPGVDIIYYGNQREIEFDFVVAPGGDPRRIQLALSSPELKLRPPKIYQGSRVIEGRAVRTGNRIAFELAAYDRSKPLVIDPVVSFATMIGGGATDRGAGIALDPSGAAYIAGTTQFSCPQCQALNQVFVAKLNPSGSALLYSTYLGAAGQDTAVGIAVDAEGNAYIAANANPASFPNADLTSCTKNSAAPVAAKVAPDGASLAYAAFFCGSASDTAAAIAVDGSGNAYLAGSTRSRDFPVLNAVQPSHGGASDGKDLDGFVVKLSPGGAPIYSTYLGGSGDDQASSISAETAGDAYVTGSTSSVDFPMVGALQGNLRGDRNSFVSRISPDGSKLVYSTYLGGTRLDTASAIALDGSGRAYVAGTTTSGDFPVSSAIQPVFRGGAAYKTIDGTSNWNRSDGSLAGTPEILVVDPSVPSAVYALVGGRFFKSSDSGLNWSATGQTGFLALAINPADSTLYAGRNGGRILRSKDGGVTWSVVYVSGAGYLQTVTQAFATDPKDPSLIYAGVSEGGAGDGDGVLKSTDGGDSWKPTKFSGRGTGVQALAIAPSSTSTLYAVSNHHGLVKTTDGGENWSDILPITFSSLVVDPSNADMVYGFLYDYANGFNFEGVGTPAHLQSIYKSTDGGRSFSLKSPPSNVHALVIDPDNAATLYAATSAGVFKTADGGDSWTQVNNGLTGSVVSLAVDPSAPATLYAGTTFNPTGFVAELSPDGSALVYSTYLGGSGADSVTALAVGASGDAYLTGIAGSADFPLKNSVRAGKAGDGFVTKLTAGGAAVEWSSLLGGAAPTGIAVGSGSGVYLTGSSSEKAFPTPDALQQFATGNVFRSVDGGATWTGDLAVTPPCSWSGLVIDTKTPSHLYALGCGKIYQSTDSGASWTNLAVPFSAGTLATDPVNPFTLYSSVYTVCCGIFKSTDGGATWIDVFPPLGATGLAIDPKKTSTVYAATAGGIVKSTDAGRSWTRSDLGICQTARYVVIDPQNTSILYAAEDRFPGGCAPNIPGSRMDGLFRSTDAGGTWTSIDGTLPAGTLTHQIAVDPLTSGVIYAAASSGLFRSVNGGDTWTAIGNGLPPGNFSVLTVDPKSPSTLYLGHPRGGIYKSTDSGANWSAMPLRFPIVTSIVVDPLNPARIYATAGLNPVDAFVMKIVE